MVKLVKKYVKEAKQVGILYHVCNLESVAKYIAPTDTLSSSGNYKNWMLGGRTDVVSFTRDKNFVVKTSNIQKSLVLFNFKCDGDKLSERYRILPYNDFAYDADTGKKDLDSALYAPEYLEKESVLIGSIKNFSSYVDSVRFCALIRSFTDLSYIRKLLDKCLDYLTQFKIIYDPNLLVKGTLNDILTPKISFPSFLEFVDFVYTIDDFISGKDIDINKVKKCFSLMPDEALNNFIQFLTTYRMNVDPYIIQTLVDSGADPKKIDYSNLSKDALLKFGKYLSNKDKIKYIMPFVTMDLLRLDDSLFTDEYFKKDFFKEKKGEDLCRMLRATGVLSEDDLNNILLSLYNT